MGAIGRYIAQALARAWQAPLLYLIMSIATVATISAQCRFAFASESAAAEQRWTGTFHGLPIFEFNPEQGNIGLLRGAARLDWTTLERLANLSELLIFPTDRKIRLDVEGSILGIQARAVYVHGLWMNERKERACSLLGSQMTVREATISMGRDGRCNVVGASLPRALLNQYKSPTILLDFDEYLPTLRRERSLSLESLTMAVGDSDEVRQSFVASEPTLKPAVAIRRLESQRLGELARVKIVADRLRAAGAIVQALVFFAWIAIKRHELRNEFRLRSALGHGRAAEVWLCVDTAAQAFAVLVVASLVAFVICSFTSFGNSILVTAAGTVLSGVLACPILSLWQVKASYLHHQR